MVYVHDADDRVKAFYLKPSALGSEGRVAIHTGPVLVRPLRWTPSTEPVLISYWAGSL